jgi:hypothetical protein
MWFNDVTHAAYNDGIELAIRDPGYRALRIDKKEHNNKIDDEIIAKIRRSKFLVADFTFEKEKVTRRCLLRGGFCDGIKDSGHMDSCKGVSRQRSLRHSAVQPHRLGHAGDASNAA